MGKLGPAQSPTRSHTGLGRGRSAERIVCLGRRERFSKPCCIEASCLAAISRSSWIPASETRDVSCQRYWSGEFLFLKAPGPRYFLPSPPPWPRDGCPDCFRRKPGSAFCLLGHPRNLCPIMWLPAPSVVRPAATIRRLQGRIRTCKSSHQGAAMSNVPIRIRLVAIALAKRYGGVSDDSADKGGAASAARGESHDGIRPAMHPHGRRCSFFKYGPIFSVVAPCPWGASPPSVLAVTFTTGC